MLESIFQSPVLSKKNCKLFLNSSVAKFCSLVVLPSHCTYRSLAVPETSLKGCKCGWITWLGCGLENRSSKPDRSKKRFCYSPKGLYCFCGLPSLLFHWHTEGKAASACNIPVRCIWCRGYECVELHLHSPMRHNFTRDHVDNRHANFK
jgi:hypothetical protein